MRDLIDTTDGLWLAAFYYSSRTWARQTDRQTDRSDRARIRQNHCYTGRLRLGVHFLRIGVSFKYVYEGKESQQTSDRPRVASYLQSRKLAWYIPCMGSCMRER